MSNCPTALIPCPHSPPLSSPPLKIHQASTSSFDTPPHKPPHPIVSIHATHTSPLSKPRRTPPHRLTLADELGIELAAVEGEVDIEVNAVESALGRVHALEILFEILPREIRRQGDDFFDACKKPR